MKRIVMQDEEYALADRYASMGLSLQTTIGMYLNQIHNMIQGKHIEGETAQLIEAMAFTIGETIDNDYENILTDLAEITKSFTQDIAEDDTYTLVP
ncbi:MAG: hypothetical protein FWG40_11370 [Peptococcaceae bacterium]|nr:hypothetical protein [Peptococcaceae bacterium]